MRVALVEWTLSLPEYHQDENHHHSPLMNWIHRIKLKHLFTEDESPESVRAAMAKIADTLDTAPAFSYFNTKPFRKIPDGDDVFRPIDYANRLIAGLYDYADDHRIWIE